MNSDTNKLAARIYSAVSPNKDQFARFEKFIKNKYGGDTELEWIESDAFPGGFRLEVGSDVYDWSVGGRFRQLRDTLVKVPTTNGNIIPLLRETIQSWTPEAMAEQVGEVKTVGDGIATVSGLDYATFGEILLFADGVRGMVQDIRANEIGCVLFSDDENVSEGSSVRRTGKTAGVPVGDRRRAAPAAALHGPGHLDRMEIHERPDQQQPGPQQRNTDGNAASQSALCAAVRDRKRRKKGIPPGFLFLCLALQELDLRGGDLVGRFFQRAVFRPSRPQQMQGR